MYDLMQSPRKPDASTDFTKFQVCTMHDQKPAMVGPGKSPDPTNDDKSSETNKKEEKEETDSNGSSSGKSGSGNGSGSGSGGYNADCSASDQSSDDTGNRKEFNGSEQGSDRNDLKKVAMGLSGSPKQGPRRSKSKKEGKGTRTVDGLQELETLMKLKVGEEERSSLKFDITGVLPQLNGVKIKHPMDPRIDLTSVGQRASSAVPLVAPQSNSSRGSKGQKQEKNSAEVIPSIETYLHLLQVVRPFFQVPGVPLQSAPQPSKAEGASSSQTESSEGFTSFFTTTTENQAGSQSNTTTNSGSPTSSDFEKKGASSNRDAGDASSMVVLARAKKKRRGAEESVGDSASSGEKRVRIHEAANQEHTLSLPNQEQNLAPNLNHGAVPSRVVTDSAISSELSSRNASGSGSATNTGASNPTSSASGNDRGSSEEQRGGDSGEGPNGSGPDAIQKAVPSAEEHEAARERKLIDKKRKRIEMRREYEAQQQQSGSSDSGQKHPGDVFMTPGLPVTLDRVMMVSTIPRLVVQAIPPFIIVHTNAAYTQLTGVDAHVTSGKPISSFLNVLEFEKKAKKNQGPSDKTDEGELAQAAAAGRAKAESTSKNTSRRQVGLTGVMHANSFGRIHLAQVSARNHTMVGRNVSFVRENKSQADPPRPKDESSNDTSLTNSFGEGHPFLTCRVIMAPVVSAPEALDGAVGHHTTAAKKAKKNEAIPLPMLVTHYVIQLQLHDGSSLKHESNDSLSSNSNGVEIGVRADDSTDPKKLIAAIG